jgi:hypothetical protein
MIIYKKIVLLFMQIIIFNWLHNLYVGLFGLVEQINITKNNLCLAMCNGHELDFSLLSSFCVFVDYCCCLP